MRKFIENSKYVIIVSALFILIGIGSMIFRGGLNFGIDFRGGTQVVIDFGKEFDSAEAVEIAKKYSDSAVVNTLEKTQLEIKSKQMGSENVSAMFNEIKEAYDLGDEALVSEDEIGASVGKELTRNSLISLGIAIIGMLIYVAIRFEFDFGVAAIVALVHDVLITIAVFAIFNIPINTPFIASVLIIVGYSINDTIVVFDRIRENIKKMRSSSPEEVANISISQTLARSINTSITTLITIVALYIFVPTVRDFAFPLIVCIVSGAYSSIFVASPVWCAIKNKKRAKKIKTA